MMIQKKQEMRLHFVGIGGIGMSGIAEVFLNQGYRISGSDIAESDITRRLGQLGARIFTGHEAGNVAGAQVVVVSSAVRPSNPEVVEAKRLRIPVIRRAEMLGELMRGKTGIAVAGTHGKTTTTSMMAAVLTAAGVDPTIVIGGKVDSLGGTNAKLGQGQFVVAEADESDGSFLHLPATMGVITNIDNDHLDHYGNIGAVENAFVDFVAKLPFYGVAAACGEDAGVKRCLSRFTKPVVTYGFSPEWDFYVTDIEYEGLGSSFKVFGRQSAHSPHQELGNIQLHVPGKHNVLNAAAVCTIGMWMDLPFSVIAKGLAEFNGVKRRFEIRWQDQRRKMAIVDDYGHHPTEIAATLAAARAYWPGRIITVFQPHRYTRTLHCKDGFLSAFRETDLLLMTDIYSAGEDPIEGVTSAWLAEAIGATMPAGHTAEFLGDLEAVKKRVLQEMKEGDLILCMGAGSITKLPDQLVASMGSRVL